MDTPLPLSGYGLIGDTRTAALVSRHGSIDWCCFPNFDSPSVFAAILDRELGGSFSICPADSFQSLQKYLHQTNVLQTQFETPSGKAKLIDCFTVTSEARKRSELWPEHEILRVLECTSGEVRFRMRYFPRENYGKEPASLRPFAHWGIGAHWGVNLLSLQTSLPEGTVRIENQGKGDLASAEFTLRAGERALFSLIFASDAPAVIAPLGKCAVDRLEQTIQYWQHWLGQCRYVGPYHNEVHRSALTLKLLTFAPSGAIIAAPTTSLPEWPGGERNWDYRYCWLRDASFTVRALTSLGYLDEAKAYVSWLLYTTSLTRPKLQVLYSVYGHASLPEKTLSWLPGYRNSRPVRIGNDAHNQLQLDIYGEVMDAAWHVAPHQDRIDNETRALIFGMARAVVQLWNQPDEGIWEVRSGRFHHTHSKVMAWVALNRFTAFCERYGWKCKKEYGEIAAEIREQIETRGYNARLGAYTATLDGEDLDAAALLMPSYGYCDARSPRMVSTRSAIEKNLCRNGLLYRYLPGGDGIQGTEGAFGLCNFWMAANHFRAGNAAEGIRWMEAMVGRMSEVRLMSEEINPDNGEFLGNYPQAFTHIGLISCALLCKELTESLAA